MTLQQAAMKGIGLHFVADLLAIEQIDVGIDFTPDQLGGLRDMFEMMRLRGELELARSEIVAIDVFFADQTLDGIHRRRIRAIAALRALDAELRAQRRIVLRDARIALAAVTPRRAAAHAPGIEHDDARAASAQRERRRQTREPAADHGDIGLAVRRAFARRDHRGRGVEPVGVEFHRHCSREVACFTDRVAWRDRRWCPLRNTRSTACPAHGRASRTPCA